MRAIEYDRYGGPEVLELRDVPRPEPGPGEVLVRVAACALNPKDVLVRAGRFRRVTGTRFPRRMGYDFAGTVEAVGEGVAAPQVGELVYGMLNGWAGGACAEYVVAPVGELAPAPRGLDPTEAAAIPLAAQTALQSLRNLAGAGLGSRICVHGASGGVGTFAVQIGRIVGAHVTASCSAGNHDLVRRLGAHEVFDYRDTPPETLRGPFDCFFDVFGNQRLGRIRQSLSPRGMYITTVPNLPNVRDHLLTRLWPGRRARLVVVRSNTTDPRLLAQWVEQGELRAVVDEVRPLSEAADGHRRIQTKRTRGKIVLTP